MAGPVPLATLGDRGVVSPLYLIAALLGGVAAVDATPVAQTMLSQPLVTATLLGLVWGNLPVAIEVGLVLQILAVSTQPVGARTPEDYASGGVVGTTLALALVTGQPFLMVREAAAMTGVMAGIAVAMGGTVLTRWLRRRNEGLGRWCEVEVRAGRTGALGAAQVAGIVMAFAIGVSYCAACLGVGLWGLTPVVQSESLRLAKAWHLAQPLWLGLGLAQMLQAFVQRHLVRGALFGAALVCAWIVLIVGTP
jgi:mannose/fructose/N-acetylgalactosamine-specific phosphotransferase system component IIC